uniref:MSP domain-containing protein n=1 Tax=Panagrellus redivivus TaxID=6233 RepID=A0A7E4UQW9_PANRE
MATATGFNHLNGDRWLWTDDNPDVELIEPRILVSVDKNWLVFGHAKVKPAIKHTITLTNHADHPVAFKVHTSDNFAYFVNQETGLIPGRRLFALPFVKTNNQVQIDIYRRPFMYFSRRYPEQIQHCKAPRKDRCFIYIAPCFGWNTEPSSVFTHDMPFEKLRICLEYTASKLPPSSTTTYLFENRYGWNTWETREEIALARSKM